MEIVIDIPEKHYDCLMNTTFVDNPDLWTKQSAKDRQQTNALFALTDALHNGRPLPKGHGRLIDADELKEDLEDCQYSKGFCAEHYIDYSIHMGIAKNLIKDAPTIIEADKENEND